MIEATFPQKNIVILGAGFGGLTAARLLGKALKRNPALRAMYDVVFIDRNDSHTYTPGLYEVATALREDAAPLILKRTAAISIEESLRGLPIRFIQDEITNVDMETLTVRLRDSGTVQAAYLILALGAVVNDFGIPGIQEYALSLKTFEDALRIRGAVETALRAKANAHILIAGGGATGVELAGELVALARHIRKKFRKECIAEFTIIDAGPRLLPGPPLHIAESARKRLERLGVRILLNTKLASVENGTAIVSLADGTTQRLPFDIFIWSGGIKPSPVLERIVAPKDQRGRCMVDLDLTIHGFDNVFAIGDLTCFADPATGQPLPATAPIAMAEGTIAARNVLSRIARKPLQHYHPPAKPPMIVPVSGKWAIAYIFGITLKGFAGFVLRQVADLRYFLKVLRPCTAIRFFVSSMRVYFRND